MKMRCTVFFSTCVIVKNVSIFQKFAILVSLEREIRMGTTTHCLKIIKNSQSATAPSALLLARPAGGWLASLATTPGARPPPTHLEFNHQN